MSLQVPIFIEEESNDAMKYQQIVNQVVDLIAQRVLREGERLDTIKSIEKQLLVSHATVSKAYAILEERGIIETARRKGSVVAPMTKALFATLQREWAERCARTFVRQCHFAKADPATVLLAVENVMRRAGMYQDRQHANGAKPAKDVTVATA